MTGSSAIHVVVVVFLFSWFFLQLPLQLSMVTAASTTTTTTTTQQLQYDDNDNIQQQQRRVPSRSIHRTTTVTQQQQEEHGQRRRMETKDSPNQWYTRYPEYPPYCSTPEEMSRRTIPPLSMDSGSKKVTGETRIQHVTAILRHGARTPYTDNLNCWEDYATNPETAVWDCDNFYSYMSPPPPSHVAAAVGVNEDGTTAATTTSNDAMFLFEKRYDALSYAKTMTNNTNLTNYLRGSCQLGQLLLQGYEQELMNGQFLRDAYTYNEATAYNHDARMRLLDIGSSNPTPVWNQIHYRVDDEMRTLLSGQIVLRGLFGPEIASYVKSNQHYPVIPLHTADYDRDILDPNERICPRLVEIRQRQQASPTYQALNQSVEANLLRKFQQEVLNIPRRDSDMNAIDCLMTTMCTDRPLPAAVNDYHRHLDYDSSSSTIINETTTTTKWYNNAKYGTNLFERLVNFDAQQYVYIAKADNAEYSKIAMTPLWYEISSRIKSHMNDDNDNGDDATTTTTSHDKLHLISGHDTTLIPLMATLGLWNDTDWPSYASMMIIELHELNIDGSASTTTKSSDTLYPSNYAFRVLYNGAVLTSQIVGCPHNMELCDISILLEQYIPTHDNDDSYCQRQHAPTIPYQDVVATVTRDILSTPQGILYLVLLMTGSAMAGGVIVFLYMSSSTSAASRARYHHPQATSSTMGRAANHFEHDDDNDPSGSYSSSSYTDHHDDRNGYHDDSEDPSERSIT